MLPGAGRRASRHTRSRGAGRVQRAFSVSMDTPRASLLLVCRLLTLVTTLTARAHIDKFWTLESRTVTEIIRLSSDGPHDDDYTGEVAGALSGAVRVLNHATRSRVGITYPSTVYDVLGSVALTAAGLDQLLKQLGEALRRMQASGRLGDDLGNPAERLDKVLSELATSREMARDLAAQIDRVFNTTATLHLSDGGEDHDCDSGPLPCPRPEEARHFGGSRHDTHERPSLVRHQNFAQVTTRDER